MRLVLCGLISSLLLSGPLGAAGRAAAWRPERVLGSARLSMGALGAVVLPAGAGKQLVAAAEDLRMVFEAQVGGELSVVTDEGANSDLSAAEPEAGLPLRKQAIYLRLRGAPDLSGGFSIRRERTRVYVDAASQAGLVNGVYALCGEVLGARWYWAGDLGLEFVGAAPAKFPERSWSETPAFVQRTLYPSDGDFGRRNRLVGGFQFNHALSKVFTAELFEAEPDAFSFVNGHKRRPTGSGQYDPQPNFAEPRTVELAAEAALRYFEENPDSRSFSLSINDNVLFDESAATQAVVEPLRYFRRRPDYSDLVFGFMNAVAERVFDQGGAWQTASGEDRYLTALAYFWTEPAPTIRIHPRVMPVLTSDRAQWQDPDYRTEDQALIARWAESGAERIATWDYYFGAPYPYPRQFNQWIDESLKYLHAHGVDVFFSQLPSAWGLDGAKAWLAAELLWDPERDAEALLDEYYTHFFGAAAEPMRRFYETAEAQRNANEGAADWIKFYKDEAGIGLFPLSRLVEMRGLIERAKAAVADDARRLARVEVVSGAFTLTESYAAFQRARERMVAASLAGAADVAAALSDYQQALKTFRDTAAEVVAQPVHRRLSSFTRMSQSDPAPMAWVAMARNGEPLPEAAIAGIEDWVADAGAFRSVLKNVGLRHEGTWERNFLGPLLPQVPGWYFDFRPSEFLQVTGSGGGASGIRVSGADVFSIFSDVPVIPERTYLLDATARWRISPDNRTQIKLIWTDRGGNHLRTDFPLQLPWGASEGAQRLVIPFRSPVNAYDVRIRIVTSRQYSGDFLELERVDFGMVLPGS